MKDGIPAKHKTQDSHLEGNIVKQLWEWVKNQQGYAGFVAGVLAIVLCGVLLFRTDISNMMSRLTPEGNLVVLIIALLVGASIVGVALLLAFLWFMRQPLKVPSSDDTIDMPRIGNAKEESATSDSLPKDARLHHFTPPLVPTRFFTLPLPKQEPFQAYGREYAPSGLFDLGDIPFVLEPIVDGTGKSLGHRIIDLRPADWDNAPAEIRIQANVDNVSKVHFLLTAGHGRVEHAGVRFQDKSIGFIEMFFVGAQPHKELLILGKNIREWAYGNAGKLVRTIDSAFAKPVWIAYDYSCLLDAVPIKVSVAPGLHLDYIRVVAVFQETHAGHMKPAVRLSAVTCERS